MSQVLAIEREAYAAEVEKFLEELFGSADSGDRTVMIHIGDDRTISTCTPCGTCRSSKNGTECGCIDQG